MKNLRLSFFAAVWLMASAISTAANWTDVTQNFIKNPGFDKNSSDGWTWDSNADTQEVRLQCISFNNGYFDLYQRLRNLPKGHYRLSVQGFYRMAENNRAYSFHQADEEDYETYLYAGDERQLLKCIYDESMDNNAKNKCYTPDGKNYYPNAKEAAVVAFSEGMYVNTLEFDAEGDIYIGVCCFYYWYDNYCALDNFKLEYDGEFTSPSAITLSLKSNELVVGEQCAVNVALQPEGAVMNWLDWTSSDEQVVTVNYDGTVTAVGEGMATITATAVDGSGIAGTIDVTVIRNQATEGTLVVNEVMASNVDEYLSPAFNYDGWIELYNPTEKTVELRGLQISDPANGEGPWTMPEDIGVVPAKGYGVIWFGSENICPCNVPFKLNIDGGSIVISNSEGKELVHEDYPASMERISYARATDGIGQWGNTDTTTPGTSNNGIIQAEKMLDAPVVDQPSQLFTGEMTVNVTIPDGCTLRYTSDGSLPTLYYGETSKDGRFVFNDTRILRFRLFADGMLPSRVTTRSYIYKNQDYYLPVVSVVGNDYSLYGKEYGPLYDGISPNGRPGNGQNTNRNYNMDWERPVNFSYLDSNGKMVFNQDVNLEMCGGWSRAWYPHSFKLKGNKELGGDKNLLYPFFDQKPYIRNRTLQIRNGGNDNYGRFKDPALQYMAQSSELNIDCQSYQPVHEFINWSYVGVLNMREPNNKHYVYANYGWNDDEIDQFEMSPDSGYIQKCGTPDAFNELVDVLSPNADNNDTYEEICRLLDIDSYVNYMALQMYLGNWDWPQNNVKGFRHRDNGRFRFILFDLDGAFSSETGNPFTTFMGKEKYTFDQLYPSTLKRHVNEQIRFVTLFKNMLKNQDFCRRFVDAFCLMGGSVYQKDRARQIIVELLGNVEPAMNIYYESSASSAASLMNSLNSRMNTVTNFLKSYPKFGIQKTTPQVVILKSDAPGAKLFVNGQVVPTERFEGRLFAPVVLRAEAPAGYVFKAWINKAGNVESTEAEMSLPSGNSLELTATFTALSDEEKKAQGITPVRINEVSGANDSYIDEYGKKGDWVELFNTTDQEVDVEGMYLSDDSANPTKYQITKGETTANTRIAPHGYLVIWCDDKRATTDRGLHASFKIDADGGIVVLTAADQSWTESLTYGAHDSRTTIGRYPDGTSNVYAMNISTIGSGNQLSSYAVSAASGPDVAIRPLLHSGSLHLYYASQFLLVRQDMGGRQNAGNVGDSSQVAVSIYRTDGVLVRQATLNTTGGKARLDISALESGMYVAKAIDSNGISVTSKFVK